MPETNNQTVSDLRQKLAEMKILPDDNPRSMPAQFYTSEDFLKLETEHVLRREWMCIGHVGEVSNPGDFYTTEILDEQILVTRDIDGVVRVLSNVCRHRGNRVAEGSGNSRKFTCRYHSWTYNNRGALLAAPLMNKQPNFDKEKCGLPEFTSEIWKGWIFVNLDGTAAPLAPRLASLEAVIKNYHQEDRFLNFIEEDNWSCNCLLYTSPSPRDS